MIAVNQAVSVATQNLRALFGEVSSVRLEEVFQTEDESAWGITLSFLAPVTEEETVPPITSLGGLKRRYYKTFEIDAESGKFRSMKIRPVPSV